MKRTIIREMIQMVFTRFRFRSKEEIERISHNLSNGGTASHAILRELQLYTDDPKNYRFGMQPISI